MKDEDLKFSHLRILRVLLEVRSATRAADVLGLSQSTISKGLVKLREHFGDTLFVRAGLELQPTPRALELEAPLLSLLGMSEDLRAGAGAFDAAKAVREFRVLVTEVGMVRFVPLLMDKLESAGSGLRLKVVPFDSRRFTGKLESGEADIALGAFPKAAGSIRRQILYSDGYRGVIRSTHPRLDRLGTASAFLAERHVLVVASSTGHAAHEQLEKRLSERLDAPRIGVKVPSFVTAAFVASRTNSVATLPAALADYLAKDLQLHIFVPPLSLPKFELAQYWHERMNGDPAHRWLRALVAKHFQKP